MALPKLLDISFEFSPKLGVRELPEIDEGHESNVDGLYIIGDLADAPIIKVALRQGYDVAQEVYDAARAMAQPGDDEDIYDVVIIGAGPAGIGAALKLRELGASYIMIERERPFSTIQNFPLGKIIFSEPREYENPGNFWFEDATKEDLVERWDEALKEHSLPIQQPEEVKDTARDGALFLIRTQVGEGGLMDNHADEIDPAEGARNVYRARRVILATGKRGKVNRLGVPGEDLDHVQYALKDPAAHSGQKIVVVGGGDSAVETAASLADHGADVTISYRRDGFHRVKSKNRDRIKSLIDAGKITPKFSTNVKAITKEAVTLEDNTGKTEQLTAEQVFIHIGTRLPRGFLKRLGVRMKGEMTPLRIAWIMGFAFLTWIFYILKSGLKTAEDGAIIAKRAFFPFHEGGLLESVPAMLQVDLGFRVIDGAFWGTFMYGMLILIFGIRAYRKYPSIVQKRRYLSLIGFQWIFLFGIPELLAPFVINLGGEGGFFYQIFGGERGWKFYGLSVPWPLNIWGFIDAPSWTATGNTLVVITWLLLAASVTFVLIPLYVRREGERFCSYMCGCGGLAETLGDFWRDLAPRGLTAKKSEVFGRIIFVLAIPTTLLILNDAWGFISSDALYNAKVFAEKWYTLMVDFWLASILGVALYPYLGNRVWCRFFCPLRAYMEELSRRFSRIAIASNDKCIGCNECTRYCQMGINVQQFAQTQTLLTNENSSCIQCGICIQVCPMEVLSIKRGEVVRVSVDAPLRPPHAEWEARAW
ncbi:MAG: NAD(P)-binding domain-containing protein [Myxococcota bacterium]